MPAATTRSRAVWDSSSDRILINTLMSQRDEGMQTSNGNWHTDAWGAAERELAGSEEHSGGAVKTSGSCQNRWASLKKEYRDVKQLRELSGFGWDDEKKIVVADASVWEALLKSHPPLKKWRKASFPLFNEMADLIEGTYATGAGVFRPGRDFTPETADPVSDNKDNIDPILRTASVNSIVSGSDAVTEASPSTDTTTSAPVSTTVISSARKRDTTEDDETASVKRPRTHGRKQSSGQALSGMASSIAQLASAVANDSVVPSPQRKQAAVRMIEDDGELSEDEQIQVFRIIRRDTSFADTLLAIKKKSTRTRFIQSELNESD